jgi:hypothetical protein
MAGESGEVVSKKGDFMVNISEKWFRQDWESHVALELREFMLTHMGRPLTVKALDLLEPLNRGFGPFAFSHMGFGMINIECLHLDKNRAWLRDWIRKVFDRQAIEPTELF